MNDPAACRGGVCSCLNLLLARGAELCAAIEIKSSSQIGMEQLSGLRRFQSEHPGVPAFVLAMEKRERELARNILLLDWRAFIENQFMSL